MTWQGLLKQYNDYLPVTENTPNISLNEGNTPLLHFPTLSKELGIELWELLKPDFVIPGEDDETK